MRELQTLRAIERFPEIRAENLRWNGQFSVPTFEEILQLAQSFEEETGTAIGVAPEIKQAEYFAEQGLDVVGAVLEVVGKTGFPPERLLVQSFDSSTLEQIKEQADMTTVLLVGKEDLRLADSERMREVIAYADAVGVPKYGYIFAEFAADKPTVFLQQLNEVGLDVYVYTFREENKFLPPRFQSSPDPAQKGRLADELRLFIQAGIDGFFIDQPDLGRIVCDEVS